MTPFLAEIQKHVINQPKELSLVGQGLCFTYEKLWKLAGSYARELKARGCKRGEVVAASIGNHPYHVIAFLSVTMAGGVFLPMDVPMPAGRREEILKDAKVRFVITPKDLEEHTLETPYCDETPADDNSAAYLVYTSGSTGKPKGVLVAHRGYLPMLKAQQKAFRIGSSSRSLLTLSVCFDASLSDIGVPLIAGATLYVEPKNIVRSPRRLVQTIREHGLTHLDLPPALLSVIPPTTMPGCVETIVFGGEPALPETVRKWAKRFRMVNVYGPTEATICASLCVCDATKWKEPLLGSPLPHVLFDVINKDGKPAKEGEEGELHIGGPAVALGYINKPELTEERFYEKNGTPFYCTGDIVRLLEDSNFIFLGRNDEQVKIGGVRLQLEEVEVCLRSHEKVKRSAVIKRNNKLEAFVVCRSEISESELRHHLAESLPRALIPTTFHFLKSLPETSSGKVDKSVLKKSSLASTSKESMPSTLERELCLIFTKVLGRTVYSDSDYNEIGGTSLAAIEIAAFAVKSNISLPPSWISEEGTIKAIALRLQNEKPIPRAMTREELFNDATPSPTLRLLLTEEAPPVEDSPPWTILLTGASGFLGSHVLQELLKKTKATIFCLCRSQTIQSSDERIFTIRGDLSQPQFGLDDSTWQSLNRQVDTVFHCAASISNVAVYERLRSTNVFGTEEILRFCLEGKNKKLHYASTLSVFVASNRLDEIFYESDELDADCYVIGGYGQSKYAAELLLRKVAPHLSLITFHRFGLITGHSKTGKASATDLICKLLQNGEAIPDESNIKVDITPIDYAASAMVHLSLLASETSTFHISAGSASAAQLREVWQESKTSAIDAHSSLGLCRFKKSFETFRDLDIFQATNVTFDTKLCDELLEDSPIIKPKITRELLSLYSDSSFSPYS